MWLLYIILVLGNGQTIVKANAFESKQTCVAAKQSVVEGIATYPNLEASLTCVKINKVGKIS